MSPSIIHGSNQSVSTNGHSNRHTNGSVSKKSSQHGAFGTHAIHVGSEPAGETGAMIPAISLSTTYKQDAVGVHKRYEISESKQRGLGAHPRRIGICLWDPAHMSSAGLQVDFLDLENASDNEITSAIRANTKLIWIESPTNPTLRLIDIAKISRLAKSHPSQPLVLVDNTFLSPFYSSPLLLGADLVMHSMTKYINGHSDVLMGALILPASHRHLAVYEKLQFLQNASGAVPSPYDCWLAQRGAKTLHLRMKAHGENALQVARALQRSSHVEEVIYPGLKTHARNQLAYKSLSAHAKKFVDTFKPDDSDAPFDFPFSGMISFRIRGDEATAERFLTSTRLFTLAESLGGVESLAEHPARMTHGSIPPAERAILGIGDNLIRLSVGVEDADDLVEDVEQALELAVRSNA
ncbi:hypothetical protein CCMSSC00406_0007290 [Pleurotus cornucopiae]|uniref:Uncharacterized protein n=1 Tax=Pleurotus cornucopiae TaxID=5321 RepID=A0ACB7IJK1_PLECO|nr:hypothetical protein CCMSSC00406_0007290 [Pleurotus cornucopiae]